MTNGLTYACSFLGSIIRVCEPDYIPNDDDMPQSRLMIPGPDELKIRVGESTLHFVRPDINGLDSKVWTPFFEDSSTVIFLVNISPHTMTERDEEIGDEFERDLMLFDRTCNSRRLHNSPIIFLFTNVGMAKERPTHRRLQNQLCPSRGACKATQCLILDRFLIHETRGSAECRSSHFERIVYWHFATDGRHVGTASAILSLFRATIISLNEQELRF